MRACEYPPAITATYHRAGADADRCARTMAFRVVGILVILVNPSPPYAFQLWGSRWEIRRLEGQRYTLETRRLESQRYGPGCGGRLFLQHDPVEFSRCDSGKGVVPNDGAGCQIHLRQGLPGDWGLEFHGSLDDHRAADSSAQLELDSRGCNPNRNRGE